MLFKFSNVEFISLNSKPCNSSLKIKQIKTSRCPSHATILIKQKIKETFDNSPPHSEVPGTQ